MFLDTYTFKSLVWVYDGPSPWYFVSLPVDISSEIKEQSRGLTAGFGSLRVSAKVGQTEWKTSIFPNTKEMCYMLPVKKLVRNKEKILEGAEIEVEITILF